MSAAQRGPGRPAIGGAVHVRLGDSVDRVDRYARENGISRAEAVRRLTEIGLDYEGGLLTTIDPDEV